MNRMNNSYAVVWFSFFIFMLWGCESSERGTRYADYPMYSINVDSAKLSTESVTYNQISMLLPRYWDDVVSMEDLNTEMVKFAAIHETYLSPSENIYGDELKNAFVIISEVISESYLNELLNNTENLLNPDGDLSNLRKESYQLKSFLIHHYLLQTPRWVNMKILIEKGLENPVQIDFIMPSYVYVDESEILQSSIGSLSKIQ
ncbi:MAG: hypothetical protein EA412_04340 [Chitinophagaceae bacterium]|nr:MAG: hypothetical protein EA412_04340 [Chitinophagaceae bacterium]